MSTEAFSRLDEFFEKKRVGLSDLKRAFFGGYRPDGVVEYVAQLEKEARQEILQLQKEYEAQLSALTERSEALEKEVQGYGTCLEQIYESLASLSQSFMQLLEQQKQRDQLLRSYQLQAQPEQSAPAASEAAPVTPLFPAGARRAEEAESPAVTPLFPGAQAAGGPSLDRLRKSQ